MARLEEFTPGSRVLGLLPEGAVRVVQAEWHSQSAVVLTYTDGAGKPGQQLVYRDDEVRLTIEQAGRPWSFDGDGRLFRLVSEASRISLAYLFDPFLAVQTSTLDPLPHQIEAVYEKMLPRHPLRFLLADDPGAGKTIMAGLLLKELMIRGDVERCLVIAPGSLVEQWQDELWQRFHVNFEILTGGMIEASRSGNPLAEKPLLIARLDHLARSEELQAKLEATDWDLIVVDEAHKMSARYDGPDVKPTKRYNLGRLAGSRTRHLLLMTATPHNGKEEEFQLFMGLLDRDRFEGRPRAGVRADVGDLMRRKVKERLLRFDGRRLFPERRAYSPTYPLSDAEQALYEDVTRYVSEEMDRAERLRAEGEGRRGLVVGFALTTLQRRLASSPEAIYQSLVRRRNRLQKRLAEARERKDEARIQLHPSVETAALHFREDDDFDPDDLPDAELEELEEELLDEATAARTIAELEWEIATLRELEEKARQVRGSRADRKWEELSSLLQRAPEMFDAHGSRRKLIVFTEHRDTLNYLVERLRALLGQTEAVVSIHGGMHREERRQAQDAFTQDPDVAILVATDAAGEGINLQRAHLMVNYDLPWNPNRLEQRFGRVHRIGQTEVCHLWNLVAKDTREGDVFERLFTKLEAQRQALGDQVFDVLGDAFRDRSLRDLLIEAVRYGEQPDVRQRLEEVVDATVGDKLRDLVHERAQVAAVMTAGDVERIREEMERADARRLQPHFIREFFRAALQEVGGEMREREPGRYEVTHVPLDLRRSSRSLLRRYERITFHKELINSPGEPTAELCSPGHPLLDALIDLTLERHGTLLRQGAVLVDDGNQGEQPRALVYLQHAIQDGRLDHSGNRRVVSKRFEYVELPQGGAPAGAGWAPYLDYRPATLEEMEALPPLLHSDWAGGGLEEATLDYAITSLVPAHFEEVRRRTVERVERTAEAVRQRLLAEITHWDARANQLKEQEVAGKQPRMNSARARQRADELEARLRRRLEELEAEKQLSPLPPTVVGGALVVPAGLLARLQGRRREAPERYARDTERVELAAVEAVVAAESALGRSPRVMPPNNRGYDIESRDEDGDLHFIEVKGRVAGAPSVTVTRSEFGVGLNKGDRFVLVLAEIPDEGPPVVRYVRRPFVEGEALPFGAISVTLDWKKLIERSGPPS
ncbi:MAG: helicase-related protein [Candidatus Dormibacteraceae bacterium]